MITEPGSQQGLEGRGQCFLLSTPHVVFRGPWLVPPLPPSLLAPHFVLCLPEHNRANFQQFGMADAQLCLLFQRVVSVP